MPEFIKAIDQQCKGKGFDAFPEAFKFWINCSFRTIDIDGELWYSKSFERTHNFITILHATFSLLINRLIVNNL